MVKRANWGERIKTQIVKNISQVKRVFHSKKSNLTSSKMGFSAKKKFIQICVQYGTIWV